MRIKNLVLATGIVSALLFCGGVKANAEVVDLDFTDLLEGGDSINLDEIDLKADKVVTTDGAIIETVSYNEMAGNIVKEKGITLADARAELGSPSLLRASPYFYKHIIKSMDVTFTYKPNLDIYVQMWSQGSFRQFNSVVDFNLNRNYSGMSKQFSGKINVKFIDKNNIYWIVNGDFYNNGLTTVSGGGSVPLKKQGSLNFSVSKASNHYKYFYKYGHVYAQ
ncbi:hypothetical protein QJV45_09690 [Listeria booriae]|uniref:hypothetical protein n=1 Tax=Listeria booriae TaxID=1552123 RepID=UPI0028808C47|nr:hypothetical protein [Listeria booriae]MDT0110738.1 hypothetical protein [Listeria booriae]